MYAKCYFIKNPKPGLVMGAHTCNSSTWDNETRELRVRMIINLRAQGQMGLHTLSQISTPGTQCVKQQNVQVRRI